MVTVSTPFQHKTQRWLPVLTMLINQGANKALSLSRGDLGKVLYYFYLSRATGSKEAEDRAVTLLDRILKAVFRKEAAEMLNPTLATGLAGLGLTLEVLINEGFINDDFTEFQTQLDELIFRGCSEKLRQGDTDFLHGGTGGFHYLYYRLGRNPAVAGYLREFVRLMTAIARREEDIVYFPNRFMHSKQLAEENDVILGLSHGMIAPVLVLLNVYEAGIARDEAGSLIRSALAFILRRQNVDFFEPGVYYSFPNSVRLGEAMTSEKNRSAYQGGLRWCYGDLNVVHLLYRASTIMQVPEWHDIAERTGLATLALKDIGQTRCYGSLFCHGAAGNAHYYHYLARISQNAAYMKGYEYWLTQAYEMLEEEIKREELCTNAGFFLEGFVGSGLVMLAALEEDTPYWEKLWLLS